MSLESFFSGERLRVDFEVEKTVDIGYGIQEKHLKYNGQKLKYKAIVRNGEVVAIVTKRYKVVPNEVVKEIMNELLATPIGFKDVQVYETSTRLYWRASLNNGAVGVAVTNSIDGTLALAVNVTLYGLPVRKEVFEKMDIAPIYRRHFARLDAVDVLPKAIQYVKEFYTTHAHRLLDLFLRVKLTAEDLKSAEGAVPQKYLRGSEAYIGKSLGEWVAFVTRKIWSADLDPFVRATYLDRLASVVWTLAMVYW